MPPMVQDRYFLVGEKLIMETSETGQTYQWLKDGNLIVHDPEYDGANTPKLTVKHASSISAGMYTCRVDGNDVNRFRQILSKSTYMQQVTDRWLYTSYIHASKCS